MLKNQAYYVQYYSLNIMIMLSKMLQYFTVLLTALLEYLNLVAAMHFKTSKESMYSVTLHIFSCNNLKLDLIR